MQSTNEEKSFEMATADWMGDIFIRRVRWPNTQPVRQPWTGKQLCMWPENNDVQYISLTIELIFIKDQRELFSVSAVTKSTMYFIAYSRWNIFCLSMCAQLHCCFLKENSNVSTFIEFYFTVASTSSPLHTFFRCRSGHWFRYLHVIWSVPGHYQKEWLHIRHRILARLKGWIPGKFLHFLKNIFIFLARAKNRSEEKMWIENVASNYEDTLFFYPRFILSLQKFWHVKCYILLFCPGPLMDTAIVVLNTLRPRQSGCHFPDISRQLHFLEWKCMNFD